MPHMPAGETAKTVIQLLSEFSKTYGNVRLREVDYSHLLFHLLRPQTGDRLLTTLGIGVQHLRGKLDEPHQQLLDKCFRKEKVSKYSEFYPDLCVLPQEIREFAGGEKPLRLTDFYKNPPAMLCEWKFSSSQKLRRGTVVRDAIKLQLLSNYFRRNGGASPVCLQVVFDFGASSHCKSACKRWYEDDAALRASIPDVTCIRVFKDGELFHLTEEN